MKKRILIFVDRMLRGGIQVLIINWIKNFDKDKYEFDILLLDDGVIYPLEDTLHSIGVKNVYKLKDTWVTNLYNYIKYKKNIKKFFKSHHDYDAVHLNSSSKNYYILKIAKKYNIPVRISHSHNTGFQTKNKLKIFIGNVMKRKLFKYSTVCLACSKDAANWLYGDKFKNVIIMKNGIELNRFKFNLDSRNIIREKYGLSNYKVIGHVGRFSTQKNHNYLIKIFYEILKIDNNYRLLLVGEGSLENEIKEETLKLGIDDKVIFAGPQDETEKYYSAMDLFVFPSVFEGFGLTCIEAQVNGLSCVVSNGVPLEAKISDNIEFVSLKENPIHWAHLIVSKYNNDVSKRCDALIKTSSYDIIDNVNLLSQLYLPLAKNGDN